MLSRAASTSTTADRSVVWQLTANLGKLALVPVNVGNACLQVYASRVDRAPGCVSGVRWRAMQGTVSKTLPITLPMSAGDMDTPKRSPNAFAIRWRMCPNLPLSSRATQEAGHSHSSVALPEGTLYRGTRITTTSKGGRPWSGGEGIFQIGRPLKHRQVSTIYLATVNVSSISGSTCISRSCTIVVVAMVVVLVACFQTRISSMQPPMHT